MHNLINLNKLDNVSLEDIDKFRENFQDKILTVWSRDFAVILSPDERSYLLALIEKKLAKREDWLFGQVHLI